MNFNIIECYADILLKIGLLANHDSKENTKQKSVRLKEIVTLIDTAMQMADHREQAQSDWNYMKELYKNCPINNPTEGDAA